MTGEFANVIIDISHEKVDRPFQYRIPDSLRGQIQSGTRVSIPFGAGNHLRTGYVVEVTDRAEYDRNKIKEIEGIVSGSVTAESQLIELAWWMKERYGSTMNQALKTVLPVKQKTKAAEKKTIRCLLSYTDLEKEKQEAERKHYRARTRLLEAFKDMDEIPYDLALRQMSLSPATLKPLEDRGIIEIVRETVYRNPVEDWGRQKVRTELNGQQQAAVHTFLDDYRKGIRGTYLLHGITGSGKTEVYMAMMEEILDQGKEVIVLIPEIALTYQTVMRFYRRFGNRVSIINSRLSAGERYDQFERAKNGEISIMIGPRSALFTPFRSLGLIVIDEEQEGAYKSEISPRYHARETAVKRAAMNKASVVLGSATPSVEAYQKALSGEYKLLTLTERAKEESRLAEVEVVDLREELREGNRSIFSRRLQTLMEDRLAKGEQAMLFINRRGYSSFVSCRSCGEAVKCPHCDVSMTFHSGRGKGSLVCHYCGYRVSMPDKCPSCGSPYIAGFGTGTQKLEEMTRKMFPAARVLRMDMDTTSKKGGHEEILTSFAAGEADILIGTQMIVKGHDFPNVTLVGVMAADLSLYMPDYRACERTFQLLTQAAGRAGRGREAGRVVIQTYQPEHYSITAAAVQDYETFYRQEEAYRRLLKYPPFTGLFTVFMASSSERTLNQGMDSAVKAVEKWAADTGETPEITGPAEAPVYKVNDIYRKILYIKHENYDILIKIRNYLDEHGKGTSWEPYVQVQYDIS
ncbi:primosomal protein N' [Clostridium sp. AM58-1XD]|uniref:replication restart helicase PriA n=1 Tax=Clostridium sp. AM58-1XD TaxID=2292307 RepID=UPI000E4B0653|nr:primosomal protein N' [Clostridium sp. AM58-1XD]RGY99429.1 primosomal protein N' [Clostridium sp. AM58-1XD]